MGQVWGFSDGVSPRPRGPPSHGSPSELKGRRTVSSPSHLQATSGQTGDAAGQHPLSLPALRATAAERDPAGRGARDSPGSGRRSGPPRRFSPVGALWEQGRLLPGGLGDPGGVAAIFLQLWERREGPRVNAKRGHAMATLLCLFRASGLSRAQGRDANGSGGGHVHFEIRGNAGEAAPERGRLQAGAQMWQPG